MFNILSGLVLVDVFVTIVISVVGSNIACRVRLIHISVCIVTSRIIYISVGIVTSRRIGIVVGVRVVTSRCVSVGIVTSRRVGII